MSDQDRKAIWEPVTEHIDELGRSYTFIVPSALDWVALAPRLEAFIDEYQSEEGESINIPKEAMPDVLRLFIDLVKAGVQEYRDDPAAAERLPLHPLQLLGHKVVDRFNATEKYIVEQKKR